MMNLFVGALCFGAAIIFAQYNITFAGICVFLGVVNLGMYFK